MTNEDLINYRMNTWEEDEWHRLSEDVRQSFLDVFDKTPIPKEMLEKELGKTLSLKEHFVFKGYAEKDGFFYIEMVDYGELVPIFVSLNYEDAKDHLISNISYHLSYEYSLLHRKDIQRENEHLWRYRRIDDGIVKEHGTTRILSHLEEQDNWIYDAEYDYRKYWFELYLSILKGLIRDSFFMTQVKEYEDHLNHGLTDLKWTYYKESETFEIVL